MKDYSRLNGGTRDYVRFYVEFVDCDFCGEATRGRVYDGEQEVVCGSCGSVLIDVEIEDGGNG
jgi:hypothetical protein